MELTHVCMNNKYNNVNELLRNEFCISNRLLTKLIKQQTIFLNGRICDTRTLLENGDNVVVNLDIEENNTNIVPTKMDLSIIYEDDWFLVVNKPCGIAIHPSMLHYDTSLSNGIKYYFDTIGLKKKIRPVNRLDFNTSGLVIFAKSEYIQEAFHIQMAQQIFKKYYLAIVNGEFSQNSGTINLPIGRKPNSIIERCICNNGQPSITHYQVLKSADAGTLVQCILETGRTHQIRVHMAAIGHPLLGDTLYGSSSTLIDRQALHSYKIKLIHPVYKKEMSFTCDLPLDMKNIIK